MRELSTGNCDHCRQTFGYYLIHRGFSDFSYAYCEKCGRTNILSMWGNRMSMLPTYPSQQEICVAWEAYIQPCECGGAFEKGASPRCPLCGQLLSAEMANAFILRHWQERPDKIGKVGGSSPPRTTSLQPMPYHFCMIKTRFLYARDAAGRGNGP